VCGESFTAHRNLGSALREMGEWKGATDAFHEAIRLSPDHPLAHFNLGIMLLELRRWEEAADALRQATRIRPDDAGGRRVPGGPAPRPGPRHGPREPRPRAPDAGRRGGLGPAPRAAIACVRAATTSTVLPGDSSPAAGGRGEARPWYDRAVEWMEKNAPA